MFQSIMRRMIVAALVVVATLNLGGEIAHAQSETDEGYVGTCWGLWIDDLQLCEGGLKNTGNEPQVISFSEIFEGLSIQIEPDQQLRVIEESGNETVYKSDGKIEAVLVPDNIANLLIDGSSEPAVGRLAPGKALVVFMPDRIRDVYFGFPESFIFGIEGQS